MSKNGTALKAQSNDFVKSHLLVVKPDTGTTTEKVSKLQEKAEDVMVEPIDQEEKETVNVMDVIQKVNDQYNSGERILPSEKARQEAEAVAEPTPTAIAPPSIEDIKRKAELLTRLNAKYDKLIEKRKRMENFKVSHDNDTAEILLHDAKGESFKSHSPKAIAKFIEFCKDEFSEVIKETEKEMREIA